jgi:hypothetical protein
MYVNNEHPQTASRILAAENMGLGKVETAFYITNPRKKTAYSNNSTSERDPITTTTVK